MNPPNALVPGVQTQPITVITTGLLEIDPETRLSLAELESRLEFHAPGQYA